MYSTSKGELMEAPTNNLAARAGRWSAQHRKKAVLGWLAFVVLAVVIGGSVGTRTISDEEYGVGESSRADAAVNAAFPDKADESVLVQSKRYDAGDPEFKTAVRDLEARVEAKGAREIESPYAQNAHGRISK